MVFSVLCLASGKLQYLSSFVFLMLLVGKKKEHAAVWTCLGTWEPPR